MNIWVIMCAVIMMSLSTQQVFAEERTCPPDKGVNYEQVCDNGRCQMVLYSTDRYFCKGGEWNEISEEWGTTGCEVGYTYCATGSPHYHAHVKGNINDKEPVLIIKDGERIIIDPLQFTDSLGLKYTPLFTLKEISGNSLIYQDILQGITFSLDYTPHNLRKSFGFSRSLTGNIRGNISIVINTSTTLERSTSSGRSTEDIILTKEGQEVARFFAPFFESFSFEQPFFEIAGDIIKIVFEYAKMVFPFTIDPTTSLDYNSITVDGETQRTNSTPAIFNDFRNNQNITFGHAETAAGQQQLRRGWIEWNLTSFPSEITFVNVKLGVFVRSIDDDNSDMNVTLIGFDPHNFIALSASQFGDLEDNAVSSINLSLGHNRQYNLTLDSAGVARVQREFDNKSDLAFSHGLRNAEKDQGNNQPDTEGTRISSSENSQSATRPQLYVDYGWRPRYYNLSETPASPQNLTSNITVNFNITVTFPNGAITNVSRVFLNINGTNMSASNLFGNIYNVTVNGTIFSTNKTYSYCWFMNETGYGLANSTPCFNYVIGIGAAEEENWQIATTLSLLMAGAFLCITSLHRDQKWLNPFLRAGIFALVPMLAMTIYFASYSMAQGSTSTVLERWYGQSVRLFIIGMYGAFILLIVGIIKEVLEWRKRT